jgi:hypothetical protein
MGRRDGMNAGGISQLNVRSSIYSLEPCRRNTDGECALDLCGWHNETACRAGHGNSQQCFAIHVVGVAMGAQDGIKPNEIGRSNGRRHHPDVRKSGSRIFLGKRVGQIGVYGDGESWCFQKESGLSQPP